ncbi:hypothetical protein RRG08_039925 [Elysia crispata]|uniref:Uncharacterized protein n=1 Tax=Elysia crispata TaxID=231223 RepID=A0AAE1BCQ2_9GAST|nr:hypothetical protein RRG08_039925 [Elysia crispata]
MLSESASSSSSSTSSSSFSDITSSSDSRLLGHILSSSHASSASASSHGCGVRRSRGQFAKKMLKQIFSLVHDKSVNE